MHSLTISGFSALPYVALILVLQGWHLNKTIQQHWLFLQSRQWQFDGSEIKLLLNGNWQVVNIQSVRVLQSVIVIHFNDLNTPKKWRVASTSTDTIMFDACEAEAFRQARAYLRTEVQ